MPNRRSWLVFIDAERARRGATRVGWVDHTVVPQAGRCWRSMDAPLGFVLFADRRAFEGFSLPRHSIVFRQSSMPSRLTVASTPAVCSPPITEMRAFGHIHRKRGS